MAILRVEKSKIEFSWTLPNLGAFYKSLQSNLSRRLLTIVFVPKKLSKIVLLERLIKTQNCCKSAQIFQLSCKRDFSLWNNLIFIAKGLLSFGESSFREAKNSREEERTREARFPHRVLDIARVRFTSEVIKWHSWWS